MCPYMILVIPLWNEYIYIYIYLFYKFNLKFELYWKLESRK
jgi:hypothetical protein